MLARDPRRNARLLRAGFGEDTGFFQRTKNPREVILLGGTPKPFGGETISAFLTLIFPVPRTIDNSDKGFVDFGPSVGDKLPGSAVDRRKLAGPMGVDGIPDQS